MNNESVRLPSSIVLPGWADPRLVVRLKGNDSEHYIIDHNPHTFPGLVGLYALRDRASLSARPSDIIAYSEFTRGWLSGYLMGNQPSVPGSLAEARRDREDDYFLDNEREIGRQRAGLVSVNACVGGLRDDLFDEYRRISDLLAALGEMSSFWIETGWIPVEEWIDPIQLPADPVEIERAFSWLNPGYLMEIDSQQARELRLTNDEYESRLPQGAVELIVSIDPLSSAELTINFETIDPIVLGMHHKASENQKFDALARATIAAYRPDLLSISTPPALGHSDQIGATYDDNVLIVPSGPFMYFSSRVDGADYRQLVNNRFHHFDLPGGILVRFDGDSDQFTVEDGNYVSRLLSG